MNKKYLFGFVLFLIFMSASFTYAQEAILVEDNTSEVKPSDRIKPQIEEYVEKTLINSVLKIVGDIFRDTLSKQELQVFPVIAYNAIHQTTLEAFKQEKIKEIVKKIYDERLNQALEEYDKGITPEIIQATIRTQVDSQIKALVEERIFQVILEEMLKAAVIKHREIIAKTVAQRRMQLAAIEQYQKAIEKQLMQKYLEAIQRKKIEAAQRQAEINYKKQQLMQQQGVYSTKSKSPASWSW